MFQEVGNALDVVRFVQGAGIDAQAYAETPLGFRIRADEIGEPVGELPLDQLRVLFGNAGCRLGGGRCARLGFCGRGSRRQDACRGQNGSNGECLHGRMLLSCFTWFSGQVKRAFLHEGGEISGLPGKRKSFQKVRRESIRPAAGVRKCRRCGPRSGSRLPVPDRSLLQCGGSRWGLPGLPPAFPAARHLFPWSRSYPWHGPRTGRRILPVPTVQTSGGPEICGRFPHWRPGSAGNPQSFPAGRCR